MIWAILGIVAAAAAGAATALLRRRVNSPAAIDPFTVGEPWRRHLSQALSTQRGYDELVTGSGDGPLRQRMTAIGRQVAQAVNECYEIAKRGHAIDDTLRSLNAPGLRVRLERADDDAVRASLASQLASADRLRTIRDDAEARLRVLTTRMGELVAQGAEVRVGGDIPDELGSAVDEVVVQLEALREAVADVNAVEQPRQMPST